MSDETALDTPRRRVGWGLLAAVVTLAVVAVPAFWSAAFAVWSFSGCFLECSDPEPAVGAGWAAVASALLAVPVVVGTAVARVRTRWGWLVLAAVAAGGLLMGAAAQRWV